MNDSCYRRIQMLRNIPIYPAKISTSTLALKIQAQGIEIHVRTLQRDLNSLAKLFDIESDGIKDIPGWYWRKDAAKLELPDMEPAVALSFRMIKLFLEKFMPPNTLQDLRPYIRHSEDILNNLSSNHLSNWNDKVAMLSRSQPLNAPIVDPVVLAEIYQALLTEQQFDCIYKPRGEKQREYTISPRGVVFIDQVAYLVGTLWEYDDIRQFALHRFVSVEITDTPNHPIKEFDLQNYIQEGNFEYLVQEDSNLSLKLRISKGVAQHLSESKISEDQKITKKNEHLILSATAKNTQQLRWWLLSFGDRIEVLKPNELRNEFVQISQQMASSYAENNN